MDNPANFLLHSDCLHGQYGFTPFILVSFDSMPPIGAIASLLGFIVF